MSADNTEVPDESEATIFDDIELTEDDLLCEKYKWERVIALAGVGAALMYAGYCRDSMPDVMNGQILGITPIESARHVLPATIATSLSELYSDQSGGYAPRPLRWLGLGRSASAGFFRLAMKNEKLTSFSAGFLPSLMYELYQYGWSHGIFGVSDLVTAAGAGALTLAVSTKKVPIGTPAYEPLITVRNQVNID